MTRTDRRRLLQQLAFSESRHFSWDKDPANTMAYDREGVEGRQNNRQQPTIEGGGKGMAVGEGDGFDDPMVAGDDVGRALEDERMRTAEPERVRDGRRRQTNQPSTEERRPAKDNPTLQAKDKDLVGRVGEFVSFEAAAEAAAEEVDAMGLGERWCELWALLWNLPPKQKTSSDAIPLVGTLWRVSGNRKPCRQFSGELVGRTRS